MLIGRSFHLSLVATGICLAMVATSDARIRQTGLVDSHRDFTQRGVQIYAGFGGQGYEIGDHDYAGLNQLDGGGSFFLGLGIGLDRGLALYLEGNASKHPTPTGDFVFGTGMVGIKYAPNTGPRHRTQPYGKLGLGGMILLEDDAPYNVRHHHSGNYGYAGPAIGVAVGLDHFVGRRTAIFGELGLTAGQLDTRIIDDHEFDLMDDIDVTSGRVQFGLRFRL